MRNLSEIIKNYFKDNNIEINKFTTNYDELCKYLDSSILLDYDHLVIPSRGSITDAWMIKLNIISDFISKFIIVMTMGGISLVYYYKEAESEDLSSYFNCSSYLRLAIEDVIRSINNDISSLSRLMITNSGAILKLSNPDIVYSEVDNKNKCIYRCPSIIEDPSKLGFMNSTYGVLRGLILNWEIELLTGGSAVRYYRKVLRSVSDNVSFYILSPL